MIVKVNMIHRDVTSHYMLFGAARVIYNTLHFRYKIKLLIIHK